MTTLPAPAGTVCVPEPELYVYCADTNEALVFCNETLIVSVLTEVTPSEPVQYADALSVVPASTVAENVVVALFGLVAVHPVVCQV